MIGDDDHQFLDPVESESPTPVTNTPARPNRFAAAFMSPSSDSDTEEAEGTPGLNASNFEPCTVQADQVRDGLHLKSERQPREEWSIEPLLVGEATFRHSGWKHQRQQTWDALQRLNPMSLQCYRFSNCGSGSWIQIAATGDAARCVCNACHHRLCVPCQRSVGRVVQDNLARHCKGKAVRFVTLTLRHSRTTLASQISRLFSCWSTLRRRKDMKLLFAGGVAVLETKVSEHDGLWHVHLHIITEGQYVDQRELSRAWHEITGDSSIVDVRAIRDQQKGIAYICKYVSKPLDASLYADAAKLDEYIDAISGRKTIATFGTWRGLKLKERPAEDKVWRRYMSLLEFADACRRRDAQALRVLAMMRREQVPATPPAREPGDDDGDG